MRKISVSGEQIFYLLLLSGNYCIVAELRVQPSSSTGFILPKILKFGPQDARPSEQREMDEPKLDCEDRAM